MKVFRVLTRLHEILFDFYMRKIGTNLRLWCSRQHEIVMCKFRLSLDKRRTANNGWFKARATIGMTTEDKIKERQPH